MTARNAHFSDPLVHQTISYQNIITRLIQKQAELDDVLSCIFDKTEFSLLDSNAEHPNLINTPSILQPEDTQMLYKLPLALGIEREEGGGGGRERDWRHCQHQVASHATVSSDSGFEVIGARGKDSGPKMCWNWHRGLQLPRIRLPRPPSDSSIRANLAGNARAGVWLRGEWQVFEELGITSLRT